MLRIHQQPVIATVRQLFGNSRTMRVEEQAHLGFAFSQLLLKFRSAQSFNHFDFS